MSPKRSGWRFNSAVRVADRWIGQGHPCFVIAEAGSNHNRSLPLALKLIDVAAQAASDAVKFQSFIPHKIYVKNAGCADYLGHSRTIQEIFEKIQMPREWLPKLARHCKRKRILFLSSVFDPESADQVDPFVPAHKIASYECTHLPLIRHVARKGKPILLSTGMASLREIGDALETIAAAGNRNVVLMHCIAKYPAPVDVSNLRVIETLRQEFRVPVGLSDHSRDALVNPVATVARGGNILEKHFTLKNTLPGPDHRFAVEPKELARMVEAVRNAEAALGSSVKKVHRLEKELYLFARRRVHAIADIRRGDVFTVENVAVLRSGKARPGLEPRHFDRILGKRAKTNIRESDGIRSEDVY